MLTVSAWAVYTAFTIEQQFIEGKADSARQVIEALVYLLMVTGLATSAMAYLISRIGFFYRSRAHNRASCLVLDAFFDQPAPPVTVLIPSFRRTSGSSGRRCCRRLYRNTRNPVSRCLGPATIGPVDR